MDNFLDRYHLPRFNQDQMNNLNRPTIAGEIEAVINSRPAKTTKSPGSDSFRAELYQNTKEEFTLILLKLFYKIEIEGTLLSSFYEVTVTLIPKPHKDSTKNDNYRHFSLMNIDAKK